MKELFHRTSIRKFTAEPVAREELLTILRAGMQAPSATNQQPWEFYVVSDRQTLKDLAGASPYGAFTADAAAAIVCCYRTDVRVPQFCEIDCAICMENIWLATDSLGLGGTWIGIAPLADRMAAVEKILDIPEICTPSPSSRWAIRQKKKPSRIVSRNRASIGAERLSAL